MFSVWRFWLGPSLLEASKLLDAEEKAFGNSSAGIRGFPRVISAAREMGILFFWPSQRLAIGNIFRFVVVRRWKNDVYHSR